MKYIIASLVIAFCIVVLIQYDGTEDNLLIIPSDVEEENRVLLSSSDLLSAEPLQVGTFKMVEFHLPETADNETWNITLDVKIRKESQ